MVFGDGVQGTVVSLFFRLGKMVIALSELEKCIGWVDPGSYIL